MKDQINIIRAAVDLCLSVNPEKAEQALTALSELEAMVGEPWVQWTGSAQPPIDDDAVFEYFTRNGEHHGPTSSASRLDWICEDHQSDIIAYRLYATPPSQPSQYEAGDVASAAAQGFRDGVASVTQQPQAEPLTDEQRLGWFAWRVKDLEQKLTQALKQPQAEAALPLDNETKTLKLMGLVDDLIEKDPERAERFIESVLAKNALQKRLAQKRTAPQQAEAVPPGYVLVPVEPSRGIEYAIARARNLKASEIWEWAIDAAIAQQKGNQ